MALLVREQQALAKLEQAFVQYYKTVLGQDLVIDSSKRPDERLMFLAVELATAA